MAIIQISKIQQRSGNLVDLPQLDTAQFGFASDAKLLFIGAPASSSSGNVPENVEVLTGYSNIAFSQLTGSDGGNLNISNAENGQVLTYDSASGSWYNAGANSGGLINLGSVSNVKIGGGATGYVLETDGFGGLNWTPKGAIVAFISNITQANPGVVTTTEDTTFTNGLAVTITGVEGMTQLNGGTYYVGMITANSFGLYSTSNLSSSVNTTAFTTYTGNGRAVASLNSGGSGNPGGSNLSVQFNQNGSFGGSGDLTFDYGSSKTLTVNGNIAAANYFGGNYIDTTGNTRLRLFANGNAAFSVAGQSNVFIVTNTGVRANGTLSVTGNANVGNLGATNGILTSLIANANITSSNGVFVSSNSALGYWLNSSGNNVGKLYYSANAVKIEATNTTSNVQIAANGTVRVSVFANGVTLVNGPFSVSGNANVGNIGATNGVFTNVSGNGNGLFNIRTANLVGQVSLTTQVTGTLPITNGGTGQVTAPAALNALLPSQTGNSGRYLTTNGTNASWNPINSFPAGGIIMWSGSVGSIPSGWALCNGSSGTPDLRDKFIIGAGGSYPVGATGGASSVTLTTTQLPSHSHGVSLTTDPAGAHNHSIFDPGHSHFTTFYNDISLSGPNPQGTADTGVVSVVYTNQAYTGISINWVGDHIHTASGSTSFSGAGAPFSILPPYYALCFIMKL